MNSFPSSSLACKIYLLIRFLPLRFIVFKSFFSFCNLWALSRSNIEQCPFCSLHLFFRLFTNASRSLKLGKSFLSSVNLWSVSALSASVASLSSRPWVLMYWWNTFRMVCWWSLKSLIVKPLNYSSMNDSGSKADSSLRSSSVEPSPFYFLASARASINLLWTWKNFILYSAFSSWVSYAYFCILAVLTPSIYGPGFSSLVFYINFHSSFSFLKAFEHIIESSSSLNLHTLSLFGWSFGWMGY